MEDNFAKKNFGRMFVGSVLIALGVLFFLGNFHLIYIEHFGQYWPALLIIFGLVKLSEGGVRAAHGHGLGWIFLGLWLLVSINGFWGLDFHNSWPLLIVGWGISILWKSSYRPANVKIAEEHHHGE
jgi:LiaF transmembrane domain